MAAPVALRTDYTASDLQALARRTKDAGQTRRLLALAVVLDGGSRSDAARVGGVGLQTIRDWVLQFNADGPAGLLTGKPPGRSPRLKAEHRAALIQWIEDGPMPAVDGVVRWRLVDLAQRLFEEFKVEVGRLALGRALRAMGYRKLSARPRHHAQEPEAIEAFKKSSRPLWRRSRSATPRASR